jgi:TetR/AcrR family transcriptional repressor of nem operon
MKHALSEPGHRGRGADDAQPALREKVQQAMDPWQDLIVRAVHEGIANGESDLEAVPKGVAPLAFSSMDGACDDEQALRGPDHVYRAVNYLSRYLGLLVR